MAKSGTKNSNDRRGNGSNSNETEDLTSRPFAVALRSVKPALGPACLKCGEEIDTTNGWSLSNRKGTRKLQRNGFLHPECEADAVLALAEKNGIKAEKKINAGFVTFKASGLKLEVPVYEQEQLDTMIGLGVVKS